MTTSEILDALKEPFPAEAIRFLPKNVKNGRAMALAYIDARDVQDRLNAVMGALWQDEFVPMPNGTCCCRIGLYLEGQWLWRSNGAGATDVEGEKGAYSDAFKRAAVLWGVGRYLYDLGVMFADYDEGKRKWVKEPTLPGWALPRPKPQAPDRTLREKGLAILNQAWPKGMESLQIAWQALSNDIRAACKDDLQSFKEKALKATRGEHAVA